MATPGIPGFEEISNLATKYSPEQLQRMAASGMIDVAMATRAKFLQQRIALDVAKSQVPTTTVAQDVMAPPQSAAPQGLPAAQQMAAQPTASGLDALPVNEAEYAGGGIVAFEDGGEVMRFQNRGIVPSATATPYDREMVGSSIDAEFGGIQDVLSADSGQDAAALRERVAAQDKLFRDMLEGRTPIKSAPVGERAMDVTPPETPKQEIAAASEQVKAAKKTVDKAEDYLAKRKRMLKEAGVDEDVDKADREELARLRGETTKDRDEAAATAMIKAGLGIAGGKSQYALQNIGQGAQAAVTDYAKALRDIKADEKEYAKIERDLNKAADLRKRGEVDKALELEEKAADREVRLRGVAAQEKQATKPSSFQEQYDMYAKGEIAAGRKPSFEGFRKMLGSQDETSEINRTRFALSAVNDLLLGMKKDNPEYAGLMAKRKALLDRLAGAGTTGVSSGGAKFVGFE
jgi:hypothetical protein